MKKPRLRMKVAKNEEIKLQKTKKQILRIRR